MKHKIFIFLLVILLITSGCGPVAPTAPLDIIASTDTSTPDVVVDIPDKPSLDISGLPQPEKYQNDIMTDDVIGFAFSDGNMALMAAPLATPVYVSDTQGFAVGVVWVFDPQNPGSATDYMVSIDKLDPTSTTGYLIDKDDNVEQINIVANQLMKLHDSERQITASIRADSVCFRVDTVRYCGVGGLLSVKDKYSDKYEEVQSQIQDAAAALEEPLQGDTVITDQAISEIEQFDRVTECNPAEVGACPADILVAAVSSTGSENIGMLIALQDLTLPDVFIPQGSYVIKAQLDQNGQPTTAISLVDADGNEIAFTAEFAAYVDAETQDAGIVEIVGLKLWKICIKERCRR